MTHADLVRALFAAYRAQDRPTAERLLADDFRFTSPQDDRIDRATYLERCFPTADRFASQDLEHVVEAGPGDVLVVYRYALRAGERYRNAELITVRAGQVAEVQVFFGGRIG
jgi:ketosteroid isomerase-like protein